jgi:hypothetical protein
VQKQERELLYTFQHVRLRPNDQAEFENLLNVTQESSVGPKQWILSSHWTLSYMLKCLKIQKE